MFATSESSALLKFLFFIFETPYLNIFGMLLMPLFISLFPIEEFKALDRISFPSFARYFPIPCPDCLRFSPIFYKAGAIKLNRILLSFRRGPVFLERVTLIFLGSSILLILSYLVTKDMKEFSTFGVDLFLTTILSLIFFFYVLYRVFSQVLV